MWQCLFGKGMSVVQKEMFVQSKEAVSLFLTTCKGTLLNSFRVKSSTDFIWQPLIEQPSNIRCLNTNEHQEDFRSELNFLSFMWVSLLSQNCISHKSWKCCLTPWKCLLPFSFSLRAQYYMSFLFARGRVEWVCNEKVGLIKLKQLWKQGRILDKNEILFH